MTNWIELGRQTLTDARGAAKQVLALNLPNQVWWIALALSAIVSASVVTLQLMLVSRAQEAADLVPLFGGPIRAAAIVFAVSAITVWCMARIGRLFGGRGTLSGALALSAWLQVIMTVLSLGFTVIGLALPLLDALATILLLMLSVWIFVVFVAELHGFQNLFLVFLGVIGTSFLVASFLSVFAAATGLIAVPEVQ